MLNERVLGTGRSYRSMIFRFSILAGSMGAVCVLQLFSICYCPKEWLDEQKDMIELHLRATRSNFNTVNPRPDGTFNGFDIYYVDAPPTSTIHCVGENFDNNRSWLFRSCEYKTLCFDIDRRDIVVYGDGSMDMPDYYWSSTQMHRNHTFVAGGSQPKSWFPVLAQEVQGLKTKIGQYRPRIGHAPTGYYRFNATMLPFYRHPTSYRNPGHLLWDDFMALYTLLDIFDRVDDRLFLAQMRRPTTDEFEEPIPPFDIISRFIPLLGHHPYNIDITSGYDLKLDNPKFRSDGSERVICADHALTGSGLFSDHGENRWHGQWDADRVLPHNIGRGGLFRRYRQFLMRNMGFSPDRHMDRQPYKIIVALSSSNKRDRAKITFDEQIASLSTLGDRVEVKPVNMSALSLHQQIELTSSAAFYVSVVGGGTSTAIFLPKGAHLILYYCPTRYLDWDFWNNFPHVKVHWVPLWRVDGKVVDSDVDAALIKRLVQKELDLFD